MSKRKEKATRRARERALQGYSGIERAFQEVMLDMTPKLAEALMNASAPKGDE